MLQYNYKSIDIPYELQNSLLEYQEGVFIDGMLKGAGPEHHKKISDLIKETIHVHGVLFEDDLFTHGLFTNSETGVKENILYFVIPFVRRVYGEFFINPPTLFSKEKFSKRMELFQSHFDLEELLLFFRDKVQKTIGILDSFDYIDKPLTLLRIISDDYVSMKVNLVKKSTNHKADLRKIKINRINGNPQKISTEMQILSPKKLDMDNTKLEFYSSLEKSIFERKYTDQMVSILSSVEERITPHIAFFNLKNLDSSPGCVYQTNVNLDNINPKIDSYYSYLKLSFFENKSAAIKAEWIYFEILRNITDIISNNKEKFKTIYTGSDTKLDIIHKFKLTDGFDIRKFSNDLVNEISKKVNFDFSVFSNLSDSENSEIAFNLISLSSSKNYFNFFAAGVQGCQGSAYQKPHKKYDGFGDIHVLDSIDDYKMLQKSINYLIYIFGPLNNIHDDKMSRYLSECNKFIGNLVKAMESNNSEFLSDLLFESREVLNHDNNLLIVVNYAENPSDDTLEKIGFIPHDITFGLSLIKDHDTIKDLKIPYYGYVMYKRYLSDKLVQYNSGIQGDNINRK